MRRVYDFDQTIFRGDSTARFCLFALRRRRRLALALPRVGAAFLKMALGRLSKTQAKQVLFQALLPALPEVDVAVQAFWAENLGRIKPWYLKQKADSDLVISASPEFLLEPVCQQLGISLIASPVDKHTGEYRGPNCHGEEKVRRYQALYGQEGFEFYSDSLSDAPMAQLACRAWMVRGDALSPWPLPSSIP